MKYECETNAVGCLLFWTGHSCDHTRNVLDRASRLDLVPYPVHSIGCTVWWKGGWLTANIHLLRSSARTFLVLNSERPNIEGWGIPIVSFGHFTFGYSPSFRSGHWNRFPATMMWREKWLWPHISFCTRLGVCVKREGFDCNDWSRSWLDVLPPLLFCDFDVVRGDTSDPRVRWSLTFTLCAIFTGTRRLIWFEVWVRVQTNEW